MDEVACCYRFNSKRIRTLEEGRNAVTFALYPQCQAAPFLQSKTRQNIQFLHSNFFQVQP